MRPGTDNRDASERGIEDGPYQPQKAYALVREWALRKGLDDPGPPTDQTQSRVLVKASGRPPLVDPLGRTPGVAALYS